jgi:UDP-N-acetylmuramoylalanine--D-glutamate ligase
MLGANHMNVTGKEILILGAAKSGVAVATLLHRHGANVIVNDKKTREEMKEDIEILEQNGIPVITGTHPEGIVHRGLFCIVKNPGIPYSAPPIVRAQELNIPIYTEVEIAYRFSTSRFIGITGSNGKTTTTTLVGKMLEEAHVKSHVAGNIGTALSTVVEDSDPSDWIVTELSSFQLMGIETFRASIAAILNVYQAHLDYHGDYESYRLAKSRLLMNQTADDYAILNADHPETWELRHKTRAQVVPFSTQKSLQQGVCIEDGVVRIRINEKTIDVCKVDEIALPGSFNLENIVAATAMAYLAGADAAAIRHVLQTFRGVEHRLEYVKTINGVQYYNNSKATNTEASIRALESFTQPIVLIAGGLDRGDDFQALEPHLAKHVKAVVALGQSKHKVVNAAERAGIETTRIVEDLAEAVREAASLAEAGDVVLLAPACASWDMFQSFEERGSMFKQLVHTL